MEDRTDEIAVLGLAQDTAEKLSEAIRLCAERYGISFEELAHRISQMIVVFGEGVAVALDSLKAAFGAIEEEIAEISIERRARRRKRNRERAQAIERRYMVQIRHYERAMPYRRVYKPP